jgi:signal transduction histidine kinase
MTPEEQQQKISQLESANQNKREGISLVAHELRTSLTSLKWMLKMFLDNDFGPITDEQKNALQQGFAQNEHLIEMTTDLINFSHSDDTTTPYHITPTNLESILENVIKEFASESFKRGIPILFTKPQYTVVCRVDSDKIKIVFQNLISNALKYSNKGGGVEIALTENTTTATITIRDNGIGIPVAEQQELFKKFFRASNAKEKETLGSGLGLYTAYTIVTHHRGTLSFTSTENNGTTFIINLPCTQ